MGKGKEWNGNRRIEFGIRVVDGEWYGTGGVRMTVYVEVVEEKMRDKIRYRVFSPLLRLSFYPDHPSPP